jgi:putative transposase
MRKSRFTETQIVAILKAHDAGTPTAELARKHGIHPNTLRLWRAKYGGMDASYVAQMRSLTEENDRLKRIVANCISTIMPISCSSKKTDEALATESRGEGLESRRS